MPSPDAETSDFTHAANQKEALLIVNLVFLTLAGIFVAFRTYTKSIIPAGLWWDDCKLKLCTY